MSFLNVPDKKKLGENPQMQNQVLYAPFVKASDKVKKDVADLSLSDFQPKRFALNYDPPMIILEYLVPSTGKLYHHKMKLRRLTGNSTVPEAIKYLQKRHPLYFIDGKIRADQITDLIERLIYRVKQKEELTGKKKEDKQPATISQAPAEKLAPLTQVKPKFEAPTFKSGNSLPAVEDDAPSLQSKAKQMFDDLDLDDEGADLDFEQGSESGGEFNANELLNLNDYQNKRGKQSPFGAKKTAMAAPLSIKDVFDEKKRE